MNSVRCTAIIGALLLLLVKPAAADPPPPAPKHDGLVISTLTGSWSGTGTLRGAHAEYHMHWEWVLGDKFIRLTFENKMSRSKGENFIFTAIGFYRPQYAESYVGTWFDSRGMVLPLSANTEDSSLVTLWGTPETEQG